MSVMTPHGALSLLHKVKLLVMIMPACILSMWADGYGFSCNKQHHLHHLLLFYVIHAR